MVTGMPASILSGLPTVKDLAERASDSRRPDCWYLTAEQLQHLRRSVADDMRIALAEVRGLPLRASALATSLAIDRHRRVTSLPMDDAFADGSVLRICGVPIFRLAS
jgi:hypothetical protein